MAAERSGGVRPTQPVTAGPRRAPAWSGWITAPLARITPDSGRPAVLAAIKGVHTAIFAAVTVQIATVVWDGLRQRPGRGTVAALAIALAESAIYASNNQVCPLTPLAEELGAEDGSVADIFLPKSISSRIPLVGGSALALGLALNLRAWIRQ